MNVFICWKANGIVQLYFIALLGHKNAPKENWKIRLQLSAVLQVSVGTAASYVIELVADLKLLVEEGPVHANMAGDQMSILTQVIALGRELQFS